jgi:2-haloacid dehalogenase
VILSNASNDQIQHNVAKLGAPFHAVFTAEQAQAYKPRMQGLRVHARANSVAHRDVLHVVVQPALRPDDGARPRHREKVFVNRARSVGALYGSPRSRTSAGCRPSSVSEQPPLGHDVQ